MNGNVGFVREASENVSRADLHVHSKFSDKPSQWLMRRLGCPECFTEPEMVYEMARRRGMDFVTITDHDEIRGALAIAHLPGTFISEEITTYFPENNCKMHVLAYGITPDQHEEIQRIRGNIYDLLPYLREHNIVHSLAHPLYANNGRLTPELFEKCLLLFKILELRNGHHTTEKYRLIERIRERLTPERIAELSERHGIAPLDAEPWVKFATAGSDDHGMLSIASTYTETPKAYSVAEFLNHIREGRSRAGGSYATSMKLAHAIYSVAFNYYTYQLSRGGKRSSDNFIASFFERLLEQKPARHRRYLRPLRHLVRRISQRRRRRDMNPIAALFKQEAIEYLKSNPAARQQLFDQSVGADQEPMLQFASQVSSRVLFEYVNRLLRHVQRGDLFQIFSEVAALAAIHFALSPYYVAFGHDNKDRRLLLRLQQRFEPERAAAPSRVVLFTDTITDVNGVARTVRTMRELARRHGQQLTVVTSQLQVLDSDDTLVNFPPVGRTQLPAYEELSLNFPPLLDVMRFMEKGNFDAVHVSTPGPVGLIGVMLARLFKLPLLGTYHTDFPRYVRSLTGDAKIEEAAWRYLRWFYGQMERVLVPSNATGQMLAENGFEPRRIHVVSRGVDTVQFSPQHRDPVVWQRYHVNGSRKLLYVGRISKEKNIDALMQAFDAVRRVHPDVSLVLVGDGPYRRELEGRYRGQPVLFAGFQSGQELSRLYASSDLFVFPSVTDTLGNVVLEAQASGLPVVVSDQGGPQEVMVDGLTGRVFHGEDTSALERVLCELLSRPEQLQTMGENARRHVSDRSHDEVFQRFWAVHEKVIAADRNRLEFDAEE